eukprot:765988-Hanusia_phi.AAC.2
MRSSTTTRRNSWPDAMSKADADFEIVSTSKFTRISSLAVDLPNAGALFIYEEAGAPSNSTCETSSILSSDVEEPNCFDSRNAERKLSFQSAGSASDKIIDGKGNMVRSGSYPTLNLLGSAVFLNAIDRNGNFSS